MAFVPKITHAWSFITKVVCTCKAHIYQLQHLWWQLQLIWLSPMILFSSDNYACTLQASCWVNTGSLPITQESIVTLKISESSWHISWVIPIFKNKTHFSTKITQAWNFIIKLVCTLKDNLSLPHTWILIASIMVDPIIYGLQLFKSNTFSKAKF